MTDPVSLSELPGPLVEIGSNGELTIHVREPAVDGKANDAVARLLAAHLQLPRSRVELVSGATSRQKRFRVSRCSCFTPGVAVTSVRSARQCSGTRRRVAAARPAPIRSRRQPNLACAARGSGADATSDACARLCAIGCATA